METPKASAAALDANRAQLAASQAEGDRLRGENSDLTLSQAAAARSEAYSRAILESSTDYAVIATDLASRVTEWNSGAQCIMGWSKPEMLEQDLERIFTPEDRMAGVPAHEMTTALSAGRASDERWHLKRDGSRFWAAGSLTPLRDRAGTVIGFLKILRDGTEQRRAEAALLDSEARFRATFDQAAVGVAHVALDGRWLRVNARLCAMLGYTESELLRMTFQNVTHPDDLGSDLDSVRALIAGETDTYSLEKRYIRKSGESFWINLTVSLLRGGTEPLHFISVVEDISARKAAEEALRNLNASLEARIEERTRELETTHAQLRQSQKMEAVGQLTGGLAHDFNNLLQGIIGSLDHMQTRVRQGRIGELDRYLIAAHGAAERAAALTHRLLAFARRQTLDPKPVAANRLIAGMAELIGRTVGTAITVETVSAAGLWTVLCDPHQLENALLNLAINARDAMPDGGRLTFETVNAYLDHAEARKRDIAPGQYVAICVTDIGHGMASDVAERAFDPFFTTKPLGQGTGLGLSMVHGFVQQSGGQVRIYSEPDRGTTIKLFLPRFYGEAEITDKAPAAKSAPTQAGEAVLIVDDEPTVLMLIAELLTDLGYAALEASDAAAALRVLQSDAKLDLLVTDVGLPGGMNGRQLAAAARELRPELKVLFITGYAENAAMNNHILEPGMQVVTKPFALHVLASRITGMIEA